MENIIQEHYLEPHEICSKNGPAKNDEMDDHFKDQFVPKTEENASNIKDQFVRKQKSVSNNIIPETITIEYLSSGIID